MKIISWNVHYDLTHKKYSHIMQKNPDILIILECEKNSFDFIKSDWHYYNWYNDDLNNEDSKLGVAIFSNNYPIEFCKYFNRNYRYVIPYRLNILNRSLILFVVWTKTGALDYEENIIAALEDEIYKSYLESDCLFIGDFNTATTADNYTDYEKILERGLINTVFPEDIFKPTYFRSGKYYTNDYCLVTEQMDKHFSVSTHILGLNESIDGVNKYEKLSDHCPIIVNIERKSV